MAAVLSISPTLDKVFIGQSYRLRAQIRDDQVRRNYDLTGGGAMTGKLVSLTGGSARTLASPPAFESNPNGVVIIVIANADSTALTPGRWYIELQCPTVTAEGNGTLIPALYPFDAVTLP